MVSGRSQTANRLCCGLAGQQGGGWFPRPIMTPPDDRMGALRLINPSIFSANRLRSPIPFGELFDLAQRLAAGIASNTGCPPETP